MASLALGWRCGQAQAAAPGAPGVAVPLGALEACADPRYPALAGPYVVGCGAEHQVDRALSLETGALIALEAESEAPGLGPGVLFVPGRGGGLIRLPDARPEPGGALSRPLVAPPATDGQRIAGLLTDGVEVFQRGDSAHSVYEAHPAGWYPPAFAGPWLAWVEDAGPDGEDVRAINLVKGGRSVGLAVGPGHARHVAGQGRWLAWVEPGAVVLWDTDRDARQRFPVDTGFNAPVSLWEGVVCYETRDGADVDIACSDGVNLSRPGDQTHPSRWDRWLLFQESGRIWLYTVAPP